jgi:hypothetical protein
MAAAADALPATALICRSRDQFFSKNGQELVAEFGSGSFFKKINQWMIAPVLITGVNVFFSVFVLRRIRW